MRAAKAEVQAPRKRSLASAKFRAWWEGEAFDAEAYDAAQAQAGTEAPADPDLSNDLFDTPRDPRLAALELLWGAGRVGPPMAGEAEAPALLALPENAAVTLLGPGLFAPVAPFSASTVKVLEWRTETRGALASAAGEIAVEPLDLDVTTLPAEAADGLVSFDDFTYAGNPARLALQIARTLKPGARALIETYVGGPDPDMAPAFASAFAEPQLHQHAAIVHALTEAGLDIDADDDVAAEHVAAARAAFTAFSEKAAEMGALPPREAQELSWETQTWQARLKLLIHARLQRRRILAHRRV